MNACVCSRVWTRVCVSVRVLMGEDGGARLILGIFLDCSTSSIGRRSLPLNLVLSDLTSQASHLPQGSFVSTSCILGLEAVLQSPLSFHRDIGSPNRSPHIHTTRDSPTEPSPPPQKQFFKTFFLLLSHDNP